MRLKNAGRHWISFAFMDHLSKRFKYCADRFAPAANVELNWRGGLFALIKMCADCSLFC